MQYQFIVEQNRIYAGQPSQDPIHHDAIELHHLLPMTQPGFTMLVDLDQLDRLVLSCRTLADSHLLCIDHGMERCAYLTRDHNLLGLLSQQLRLSQKKIECGYFTRLDDALHYLAEAEA